MNKLKRHGAIRAAYSFCDDVKLEFIFQISDALMKAPSDEGSEATSNVMIARGNHTNDYVSAKLTGGEKMREVTTPQSEIKDF